MVYRIYAEKKAGLDNEARTLLSDINSLLGVRSLTSLRLLNRYDAENIDAELFDYAVRTVFSEPQLDNTYTSLPLSDGETVFAVEYLPGQFDQRADSAAQCISIISQKERPTVRTAKVYILGGKLTEAELKEIKKYVINPVEAREAELKEYKTLKTDYAIPETVETLTGFTRLSEKELEEFVDKYALAMDADDIKFCRDYFLTEKRDPTITEIRMIDTYWSDHCRHTTFLTTIDRVTFEDEKLEKAYNRYIASRKALGRTKPVNLMDIGTLAAKVLKSEGKLPKLDESEEINACTVKIKVNIDGKDEDWLLLFKNETHNHPTEIEPFGGAATCIGGAIRDPLSGRAYVYSAMRVTGAGNPLKSVSETIEGKLPQRKIVTTAAAGYSSYGNQIGLATGQVDEIYHEGYVAKRMEIGAVIGAVPQRNVRREEPLPGDIIILLGGRTGRDGCGGATGSSKSHNLSSLETCGAEVQKGNAPEERKLQRLMRNAEASLMIKRCNDFGAGGVSVAIGELADGIEIDLNSVLKKYDGLDGTELAISESQERMAVVVAPEDVIRFKAIAERENLEASVVAVVKESPRLVMNWNGHDIVNISREFLNSNGAEKHITIAPEKPICFNAAIPDSFTDGIRALAKDLNICSKRGLSERFDSTIGANTVMMPFGGKYQLTPNQALVNKVAVEKGHTDTCSLMAWGYNPAVAEKSPYHGAYLAVAESVSKLIAAGADFSDVYLSFQEYFLKPGRSPKRWGKPLAALLGAFDAQLDLGIAAIGGKDSMSGTFEDIDVPPTLVSFAVTTEDGVNVVTPEFKGANHPVVLIEPEYSEDSLPVPESLKATYKKVTALMRSGKVLASYTPTRGGIAEAVMKMSFGNRIGFTFDSAVANSTAFSYKYGSFILELTENTGEGTLLGYTSDSAAITKGNESEALKDLSAEYENVLESVYPCNIKCEGKAENVSYSTGNLAAPAIKSAVPKVLIPVFPGTNCEYDSAKAVRDAGAEPEIIVIRNLTPDAVTKSAEYFSNALRTAQMIFIPGGFSGGDEPDGSGKFITSFFRNAAIKDEVTALLDKRDGLICGICNGFQALIKLGLVPYGKIIDTDDTCPTLTYNTIGRHQSRIVRTRIASNMSPWLAATEVGQVYSVPVSHGEGRFLCSNELFSALAANGQVATQYVDFDDNASMDIAHNPNGSFMAVEGITSPDGRVFGKMGHTERCADGLYKNVPGNYDPHIFESAVKYFK